MDMETSRSSRKNVQDQPPRTMNHDASYMSAAEDRSRKTDTTRMPQGRMQEQHAKIMNHEDLNISATAEAGSRRTPSPLPAPPIGRSERRRVTRSEARRKRDIIGSTGAEDTLGGFSSAEYRRHKAERGEQLLHSAPAPSEDRESSLPFPRPNKFASAPREMATAPPTMVAETKLEPRAQSGQAQLLTPPDSDSH
jgi:hypothetical protein